MKISAILFIIVSIIGLSQAVPHHRRKELYDQRQEGKWNVRADLENFIILVIPTFSKAAVASNGSLADFLSKSIPLPHHKRKNIRNHYLADESLTDKEQFIESKTAPYHVDISRTKNHLAKLHPEVTIPQGVKEELIVARSPSVALSKPQSFPTTHPLEEKKEQKERTARAFIITVPTQNENIQIHDIKDSMLVKGDLKKKIGLSFAAIEKGLEEHFINHPAKAALNLNELMNNVEITSNNQNIKFADLSPEDKSSYIEIIVKAVRKGLVDHFKNTAEQLRKELEENDKKNDAALESTKNKNFTFSNLSSEMQPVYLQLLATAIKKGLIENFKKLSEDVKKDTEEKSEMVDVNLPQPQNITVADLSPEEKTKYAEALAKVLRRGLVEYFKKLAESMKQKEAERIQIEEQSTGNDKKPDELENIKENIESDLNMELQPPKNEAFRVKEKHVYQGHNIKKSNLKHADMAKQAPKEELKLLGATNEQCGPGLQRDALGICRSLES